MRRHVGMCKIVLALLLSVMMMVTFIPEQFFVYAEQGAPDAQVSEENQGGDVTGESEETDQPGEQIPGPNDNEGKTEVDPEATEETKAARDVTNPPTGEGNSLSISSTFELRSDGTYVMADAKQKDVVVNYSVEGPNNKILVVEVPEYGVEFDSNSLPSTNNDITEVKLINAHTFAIRIKDTSARIELANTFTLKSTALTATQAASLIDNGPQDTRIAVTEYTYDGSLNTVLSAGTKELERVVWTGRPYFNSDAAITATHTYKAETTPISTPQNKLTDSMLSRFGYTSPNLSTTLKSGEPRFKLPEAYKENGALMEIVSIRFYVPDNRLMLSKIGATGGPGNNYTRDLNSNDFNEQWSTWTITQGTDTDENNNTRHYYDLTPKSRWFNINSLNLNAFYGGMVLTWKLRDPAVPLDAATDYIAPNTIVTYRLPGTGDLQNDSIRGSEILTYAIKNRDVSRTFQANRSWSGESDANHEVVVGSTQKNEVFLTLRNNSYLDTTNRIQYVPYKTGAAVQNWEFPYQIQPTRLVLIERAQQSYSTSNRSEIASISYVTWENEDTEIQLAESYINEANAKIRQNRANGNSGIADNLVLSYSFPEGARVKEVHVNWNRLATEYKWNYPWNDSESATIRTNFDYRVNDWTDKTETAHLDTYSWVHVKYRDTFSTPAGQSWDYAPATANGYASSPSRKNIQNENYLWFRLKPQEDPIFYGQGLALDPTYSRRISGGTSSLTCQLLDDGVSNLGHLGFNVGDYGERQDDILNPVINLTISQNKQSYDRYWNSSSNSFDTYTRSTLDGIDSNQLIAFLTGEFTAMPKLAGWTFEYTTKDHPEGLEYTVPGDIPEAGRTEQIPLADGDCFTSLKLKYDGYADLSHDSETDTKTVIWMMRNIKLKRMTTNPINGERIKVHDDFHMVGLTLTGSAKWDNCVCGNSQHNSQQGKSQAMTVSLSSNNPITPRALLYSTRKASFNEETVLKTTAVQNINQGGKTAAQFDLTETFTVVGPRVFQGLDSLTTERSHIFGSGFPWGELGEAVFVELVDDEFVPDLANTTFMGYAANSAQVVADTIEVDGKRFLTLKLADGVTKYTQVSDTRSDVLKVAFTAVPGTTLGNHHPIGEIYYDASLLLEHYDAPNETGYDKNKTKYVFSNNAVEDEYGLSTTDVTGAKLFNGDGSAFTVHVDISMQAGVDLAPGKNEVIYDFGTPGDPDTTREITYYPGEEDSLNGLVTLKGPGSAGAGSIYDMESYVIIPRIGTRITWTDSNNESYIQENKNLNLYLSKAVKVLSNNGNLDVTLTYTTEPNPTQNSSYVEASQINDWGAVTGIKVHIAEVSAQTAVNLRLYMKSDAKENTDVLTAYSGGTYRYKLDSNGDYSNNGTLSLCAWKYENIGIKSGGTGSVFWDVYDENRIRTARNTSDYQASESLIESVGLTLYDSDGTIIDTATTDANGAFSLKTFKQDAGQYIVIENPIVTDSNGNNITTKLTIKTNDYPTASNTDSDFDRETNTLTLGQLPSNGLTNISAGFVKLPIIEKPEDVMIKVGDTIDIDVLVNEFVGNTTYDSSNILTNGKYEINFTGYDDTLVTINDPTLVRNGNSTTQVKATPIITAGNQIGVTEVTITVSNSLGDTVTQTFKINVNKLEVHTEGYAGVYDGDSHKGEAYVTLNGTDKVTGATWQYSTDDGETWTDTEPSATNVADSCTVLVKATYEGYGTVEGEYDLTVTPKAVTVTAQNHEFTYTGEAQSWAQYDVDGLVGTDAISAVVTGSITYPSQSPVDNVVESYDFTSGTAGNYTVTTHDGELTMVNASRAITITSASDEWTYDGSAHENRGVTVTSGELFPGDELVATATGSVTNVSDTSEGNNTIAAGYKIMNGEEDVTSSYVITPVAGTLTINPKAVTVTAASKEFTYNGTAQSWDKYDVDGLVGTDTITAVVTGSIKFPSESPVTNELTSYDFTSGTAGNYTVTTHDGELTMVDASNEITITSASDEWTYDGNAHENTEVTVTSGELFPGDKLVATATGSVTDVADTSNGNNTIANGYKIMNGDEDVTSSYVITTENGTLTIKPKAVTVTAQSHEFTYNGTAQNWDKYDVEGLVGSDAITAVVTGSIKYPSESPVTNELTSYEFTSGKAGNYTVTTHDGELKMNKASVTITITAASDEWTYDGSDHENTEVTLTYGSLFPGDKLLATATGSVKNVSDTYDNNNPIATGYTIINGDEDVTENYIIWPVAGKLTINPREVTVTITGNNDTVTYDGEEHETSGYAYEISDDLYTENDFQAEKELSASGTLPDTYYMGISSDDFTNNNDNFDVTFVIAEDGWLKIEDAIVQIVYKLNGGTYKGSKKDIVEEHAVLEVIKIHEKPTRKGYEFLYWKGSKYYPGQDYTVPLGGHTFDAVWEKKGDGASTGDNTNILGLMTAMTAATLGLLALIATRRRKEKNDTE